MALFIASISAADGPLGAGAGAGEGTLTITEGPAITITVSAADGALSPDGLTAFNRTE